MTRLAKFTKPYLFMLLASIALLFAQANFDLALPDYLSRIVNTGLMSRSSAMLAVNPVTRPLSAR